MSGRIVLVLVVTTVVCLVIGIPWALGLSPLTWLKSGVGALLDFLHWAVSSFLDALVHHIPGLSTLVSPSSSPNP